MKKRKKLNDLIIRLGMLNILMFIIAACDNDESGSQPVSLTGTWVCIEEEGYITTNGRKEAYGEIYDYDEEYMSLVFESDGTLTWDGDPYTYTYRNNKIEISGTDGKFTFSVVQMIPVNPPRMVLEFKHKQGAEEVNMRYRYLKKGPDTGTGTGNCYEAPAELSGPWNVMAADVFIYDGNGYYEEKSWNGEDDPAQSHGILFDIPGNILTYFTADGVQQEIGYCYRDDRFTFTFRDPDSGKSIKSEMYPYYLSENELELYINFRRNSNEYVDISLYCLRDGTHPGPGGELPSEEPPALLYGNLWTCISEQGYTIVDNITDPFEKNYQPGEGRRLIFPEETNRLLIENCPQYNSSIEYRYFDQVFHLFDPVTGEETGQQAALIHLDDTELLLSVEYKTGNKTTKIISTYTRPPQELIGNWTCISDSGYEITGGVFNDYSNTYRFGEGYSPVFSADGSFGGADNFGEPAYGWYYYYRGDIYLLSESPSIWYNTVVKTTIQHLTPHRLVTETRIEMPDYESLDVSEYVKY